MNLNHDTEEEEEEEEKKKKKRRRRSTGAEVLNIFNMFCPLWRYVCGERPVLLH
jgi:hypothetical protein